MNRVYIYTLFNLRENIAQPVMSRKLKKYKEIKKKTSVSHWCPSSLFRQTNIPILEAIQLKKYPAPFPKSLLLKILQRFSRKEASLHRARERESHSLFMRGHDFNLDRPYVDFPTEAFPRNLYII